MNRKFDQWSTSILDLLSISYHKYRLYMYLEINQRSILCNLAKNEVHLFQTFFYVYI
jgi:hypothetical protein